MIKESEYTIFLSQKEQEEMSSEMFVIENAPPKITIIRTGKGEWRIFPEGIVTKEKPLRMYRQSTTPL